MGGGVKHQAPGGRTGRVIGGLGGLRRKARQAARGRHGAVSMVFAVSATLVLGVAALASDGGYWYSVRRNAQTAADMAAMGGAVVLASYTARDGVLDGGVERARAAASDTAERNGFASDSIQVFVSPEAGLPPNRVRVEVSAVRRRYLAALFLSADPAIETRAVAGFNVSADVCLLAMNRLMLNGNPGINGVDAEGTPVCGMAANGRDIAPAGNPQQQQLPVEFDGASGGDQQTVKVATIVSTAGCYGCWGGKVYQEAEISVGSEETADPFAPRLAQAPLSSAALPACYTPPSSGSVSSGGGASAPTLQALMTGAAGDAGLAADVVVFCNQAAGNAPNAGSVTTATTLPPNRIYVFRDFRVSVGAALTCRGCTFVFTGDSRLSVTGNNAVTVTAPARDPRNGRNDAGLAGIGIYFPDASYTSGNQLCGSTANGFIDVGGSATLNVTGGIYGPAASFCMGGTNSAGCTMIAVGNISISGTANLTLNNGDCFDIELDRPYSMFVRLLE